MVALSWLLYVLSAHRFLLLLLVPVLIVLLSWPLRLDLRRFGWWGWGLTLGLLVLNLFGGPRLNGWFLYHYGTPARAVTTHAEDTYVRHNKRPVLRYHALLQRPGTAACPVTFESDQFNIYPVPANGYQYPAPGRPFTVRFVPGAEANFVILSDDASSPYVRQLRCTALLEALAQAARQYQFDSLNVDFNRQYAASLAAFLRSPCSNEFLRQNYAGLARDLNRQYRKLSRQPR